MKRPKPNPWKVGKTKGRRRGNSSQSFFKINSLHQTEYNIVPQTQIYTKSTLNNATGQPNLRTNHRLKINGNTRIIGHIITTAVQRNAAGEQHPNTDEHNFNELNELCTAHRN
jgi:hypothetical protein